MEIRVDSAGDYPWWFVESSNRTRFRRLSTDGGIVTAEFAVALPAVVFLLALLLAGVSAGLTQVRLEGAAQSAARVMARGESVSAAQQAVSRVGGPTVQVSISDIGEWTTVVVSDQPAGPLGHLIPWVLSATATARYESPGTLP